MIFPSDANWSKRIKLARVNKGQTQEDLAQILGTTRKQVYLWESGKIKPKEYARRKLAQWAGEPEEILFKGLL